MNYLFHFGRYLLLLKSLFRKPENISMYRIELLRQMSNIGIGSLAIVSLISVFVGAVTTVQIAYQLTSALIPITIIGSIVSESAILELAPTITCLVLAGKIGSHIASEIATMRVTEQIDAMDVMGINVASYLILPKILGALVIIPMLIVIAAFLCISGALFAGELSGIVSTHEFLVGAREFFNPFNIVMLFTKSITFAFIITSISAYQGYFVRGGALEVGAASTRAVVYSCIFILFADYLIAYLLL